MSFTGGEKQEEGKFATFLYMSKYFIDMLSVSLIPRVDAKTLGPRLLNIVGPTCL